MDLNEKTTLLIRSLKSHDAIAIAFSGGVDSSFLAKVAYDTLGLKSLAVTVDSMFIPRSEIGQARKTAAWIGIRHQIISMDKLPASVLANDRQRCYRCKKAVFERVLEFARSQQIEILCDGSNLDDLSDYRPGMQALAELNVKSPLLEARFTKRDIREASRKLGLSTWDHPSMACLASRIPYQIEITEKRLMMVEKAEEFLKSLGIKQLRVRYHHDLARIEVAAEEREKLFSTSLMDCISQELKSIGFTYVSVDLEGYRTGKMN